MEKKVFVPTIDELYLMQSMGGDIYKYLLAKAIETIVVTGLNSPSKEILKNISAILRENPDIARAVCLMYPKELARTEVARYDLDLCARLIEPTDDSKIMALDNLASFSDSIQDNKIIVRQTIDTLNRMLPTLPKYRFTYQSSKLLDDIFLGRVTEDSKLDASLAESLANIEPAYVMYVNSTFFEKGLPTTLQTGISEYARRYMIEESTGEEYHKKDILTDKPDDVKTLIKCINRNRKVIYKK